MYYKKKTTTGSRTQNKYVGCVFRRIMICVLKATVPQRAAERCVQF